MTEAYRQFEQRGVTPVAVSVDRIDEAAKTQATYTIPFPVLSDSDVAALDAAQAAFSSRVARWNGI